MVQRIALSLLGATVILGLMLLWALWAYAHSWYDSDCCAGNDCEPVDFEVVTDTGAGYRFTGHSPRFGYFDQEFPQQSIRLSKDGQFHICFYPSQRDPHRKLRCAYEPVRF